VYFSVHSEAAELCLGGDYSRVNGAIFNKQSSTTVHNARFGSKTPLSHIELAKTEISVFQKLVELFREYDPDIVVGYDAEG
jgi:DNA polymerase elongation subunit (family B)